MEPSRMSVIICSLKNTFKAYEYIYQDDTDKHNLHTHLNNWLQKIFTALLKAVHTLSKGDKEEINIVRDMLSNTIITFMTCKELDSLKGDVTEGKC